MFRKLTDRVTSAASSLLGREDSNVQQLVELGFEANRARAALQSTNGNVEQAAELLLAGDISQQHTASNEGEEDAMLQRALQESLQQPKPTRTAAMRAAARAAEERFESQKLPYQKKTSSRSSSTDSRQSKISLPSAGGLSVTHPDVKVIPKLQDKTKEEQVLRCADRLKTYPNAVDTLLRALTAVQKDPNNLNFRIIETNTPVFQRTLQSAPGAVDLLRAMNYYPVGEKLILDRSNVDAALLFLGTSALEQSKQTSEYRSEKAKLTFAKTIEQIRQSADSSESEAIQRSAFMAKCPSEPAAGRGTLVQVQMAESTVLRRFDGDDTLDDILNWIAGHGIAIRDKLLSQEWQLVDLNKYPSTPLDCRANQHHTLQYIGLFPSGKLEIVPNVKYLK
ncbi:hypothetical protein FisN_21Lh157 [Fistulifera solaris]|uniref:UBA domain-containing protein n=1 Tax=Fistulifera solaris TaxID=1519565 RepID=A0A1Z5J9N1_FISSO|nr:hypothetical protein FisN_21Lh157 [Fistulifera solaris]|eukprot:GAX10461.1 hypothetical protein FisN_21Lh157 [Fistulifera solaris]